MFDYDNEAHWSPAVTYGNRVHAARCPQCAGLVKCDDVITFKNARHDPWSDEPAGDQNDPNANCHKHGRVKTPFLCWKFEDE